jgi:hypothetical protein
VTVAPAPGVSDRRWHVLGNRPARLHRHDPLRGAARTGIRRGAGERADRRTRAGGTKTAAAWSAWQATDAAYRRHLDAFGLRPDAHQRVTQLLPAGLHG